MFKKRYFVPEREVERVRIEGGFLGNDIGLPANA